MAHCVDCPCRILSRGPCGASSSSAQVPHRTNSPFLQSHVFYCVPANYVGVMHPTLSSFYKIPQSYYVPRRIRQVYQVRLEANGMWTPRKRVRLKNRSGLHILHASVHVYPSCVLRSVRRSADGQLSRCSKNCKSTLIAD